jgi:hypothetical protein
VIFELPVGKKKGSQRKDPDRAKKYQLLPKHVGQVVVALLIEKSKAVRISN